MSAHIAHIWRHPIKAHGREGLTAVTLDEGRCMPWDRTWAVAHEQSSADGTQWVPCANFSRGAKAPMLNTIGAKLDEATGQITLFTNRHPNHPDLTFNPDTEQDKFLEWVAPLMPANRAPPARIIRVPGRGMTDSPFPSISILNLASLHELGQAMGDHELSPLRFRGNLWVQNVPAWGEFDWIGRALQIGSAVVIVRGRITRCRATECNPYTGEQDRPVLKTLEETWGHRDLGVYAEVLEGGLVESYDKVIPL